MGPWGRSGLCRFTPGQGRSERLFWNSKGKSGQRDGVQGNKDKTASKRSLTRGSPPINRQFSIPAANNTGVHPELSNYFSANKALCIRTEPAVKNDHTIVLNTYLHQKKARLPQRRSLEEGMDGCFHIIRKSV